MDTEMELLSAIFANPAEDTPRMLYADWLDEHGDPDRAAFIRAQIGLARGYDPDTGEELTQEGRKQLQAREKELRQIMVNRLGPEITEAVKLPLPGATERRRLTFDRGFINNLNLFDTPIRSLPDGLQVIGHLDLRFSPIRSLPKNLWVGGDLRINLDRRYSRITVLPEGLRVGGDLNLFDTLITTLSEGLQVGGNLNLSGRPITTLPKNLRVGRNLDLSNTPIEALPEGLQVGFSLDLSHTPIAVLPDGLHVVRHLGLAYTPIAVLPDGLHVGGSLNLHNTQLTPEAARRIPEMKGLSTEAKITGLRTAGYETLAEQVERDSLRPYDGRQ